MKWVWVGLLVLVGGFTSSGCGTLVCRINDDDMRVYGGTRLDAGFAVACAENAANQIKTGKPDKFPPGMTIALSLWGLADLPFSVVADTLILPITIPEAIKASEQSSKPADFFKPPEGLTNQLGPLPPPPMPVDSLSRP
jgi:uncharacterized protein YceK